MTLGELWMDRDYIVTTGPYLFKGTKWNIFSWGPNVLVTPRETASSSTLTFLLKSFLGAIVMTTPKQLAEGETARQAPGLIVPRALS